MRAATFDEVRERLDEELRARDGNMRQLARDIAGDNGSIETVRRALYRILRDGQTPTEETSRILERGLRRKVGYFTVAKAPGRGRRDRLEELEAKVEKLKVALDLATSTQAALLARVEAMEARAARRAPAGGGTARSGRRQ